MIEGKEKEEILNSIALSGAAAEENIRIKHIINRPNLQHILDFSSGLPRLYRSVIKKFQLILSQPPSLSAINPLEIRCCLCKKTISYPCWYYNAKYAINQIHYFVCLDATSPSKPLTSCYKKDIEV